MKTRLFSELPKTDLKRALDTTPTLFFEVARSGTIDELLRALDALGAQDDRRVRLVISALASQSFDAAALAQIAGALDEIERIRVHGECKSVPAETLEAAGFGDGGGSWWGRTMLEDALAKPAPEPNEPGRTGDERRQFLAKFPAGTMVQEARLGFVDARKSDSLGTASAPLPPALAAFIAEHDFAPKLAAVQRGEAAIRTEERAAIGAALATLDDGARFLLRELLLPKKPLHPLRAAHARAPALQGKATVEKLLHILGGDLFGAANADRSKIDETLNLVSKHLPPGSELEWADLLARSPAATQLVDRYGKGALPILTAFGLEALAPGTNLHPLANAAATKIETAHEAKAYLDRHGAKAFAEALETLDASGRAEHPTREDGGWTSIRLNEAEIPIPASTALAWLSFEDSVALLDFASKNQSGLRAALFLVDPQLAEPSSALTMGEDERARVLVRIVRDRGLDGLKEMVARANASIHDFGENTCPLWKGGAWPPLEVPADPNAKVKPNAMSVADLSARTESMLRDLEGTPAREKLDRELLGRRFVAFTYYDPLYNAGVENPEHRYSKTTFDAWTVAEAEMKKRADDSRGRALEPGWLSKLFSELHAIAARGIIEAGQTGNMRADRVGYLRSRENEQVGLPELVDIDAKTAAQLRANKLLGKKTRIIDSGVGLQAEIYFADGHRVPGLIADLDRFVRLNEGKMSAEALAAEVHNTLVGIHAPFDGNGRTSKLIIDFLLRRAGVSAPIWRQRHPLREPTTAQTIRDGVRFTYETVKRYHAERAS